MYEDAFAILKNSNCDFFDIYLEDSFVRLVEAKSGKIENVKISHDRGVGIRTVKGLSVLYSSSFDTSGENVYKMSKFLTSVSSSSSGVLVLSEDKEKSVDMCNEYKPPIEKIKTIYDDFCGIAYKKKEIKQVSMTFSDRLKNVEIINETGERLKEKRIYTVLYFEVTAVDKDNYQTFRRPFSYLGDCECFKNIDFKK